MVLLQNGKPLFTDARVADTFWKRFRGLMGKKGMSGGEALLLTKCSGIHTCFMRFAIDVVYLDAGFNVLFRETVAPWRVGRFVRGAKHVVEVPEGKAGVFQTGIPVQVGFTKRECFDE